MTYAIGHLNGNSHPARNLREIEEQQDRRRWQLRAERDAILREIRPYFTTPMWEKWVDAGPDSMTEFIQYATEELQNVLAEMFDDERVTA
jgi:hypothetical protein